jgi:hypothetical protein
MGNGDVSARGCRLYVLPAARAPIALVLRRGPTQWWHLLQWDLSRMVTLGPMSTDWAERDVWDERKRGWAVEREDDLLAAAVEKAVRILTRRQPGGTRRLGLVQRGVDFSRGGVQLSYFLDDEELADVAWADWSANGDLLVATQGGALEVREVNRGGACAYWREDLAGLRPDPRTAPAWAGRW